MLFLWPAALAAVTTCTIAGYSIGGLVGTGLAAQLITVFNLSTIAFTAFVYTLGFIGKFIIGSILYCRNSGAKKKKNDSTLTFSDAEESKNYLKMNSARILQKVKIYSQELLGKKRVMVQGFGQMRISDDPNQDYSDSSDSLRGLNRDAGANSKSGLPEPVLSAPLFLF